MGRRFLVAIGLSIPALAFFDYRSVSAFEFGTIGLANLRAILNSTVRHSLGNLERLSANPSSPRAFTNNGYRSRAHYHQIVFHINSSDRPTKAK